MLCETFLGQTEPVATLTSLGPWVMAQDGHMTAIDGLLLCCLPPSDSFITVGNGTSISASCCGTSVLPTISSTFTLNNVLVVSSLVHNLLVFGSPLVVASHTFSTLYAPPVLDSYLFPNFAKSVENKLLAMPWAKFCKEVLGRHPKMLT